MGSCHGSKTVTTALQVKVADLPRALRASITWDQGSEMAQHAHFTIVTAPRSKPSRTASIADPAHLPLPSLMKKMSVCLDRPPPSGPCSPPPPRICRWWRY